MFGPTGSTLIGAISSKRKARSPAALARTLDIALVRDAGLRIEQANAENLEASDLVMRARELNSRPRASKGLEPLSLFEQALKLDPRSIDARLGIGWILTSDLA